MCFSANVEHHFLKSNNVGRHFCPDFQGYFPDFNKSKYLVARFHPLHPASYTTTWEPMLYSFDQAVAWGTKTPEFESRLNH